MLFLLLFASLTTPETLPFFLPASWLTVLPVLPTYWPWEDTLVKIYLYNVQKYYSVTPWLREGFAIPMGLRHWHPRQGCAHVNIIHYSGLHRLPIGREQNVASSDEDSLPRWVTLARLLAQNVPEGSLSSSVIDLRRNWILIFLTPVKCWSHPKTSHNLTHKYCLVKTKPVPCDLNELLNKSNDQRICIPS